MSVLIKGMEMPEKGCYKCRWREGNWCSLLPNVSYREIIACAWDQKRHEDCPLVEVPTPHGRLIDADILYEKFAELDAQALERTCRLGEIELNEEWRKWSAILTERTAFKHDVYDAPTVIDAEE